MADTLVNSALPVITLLGTAWDRLGQIGLWRAEQQLSASPSPANLPDDDLFFRVCDKLLIGMASSIGLRDPPAVQRFYDRMHHRFLQSVFREFFKLQLSRANVSVDGADRAGELAV